MENIVKIEGLSKQYGKLWALKEVSLEVKKSSVYGILGPNGSGKTTLLSILLDVLNPTSGTYEWIGIGNNAKGKKKIGALLEYPRFYHYLSAENNLKICAKIKRVPFSDIDRVLELVELDSYRKMQYSKYSLGMKQRLAIANVLLGDPQVIVLDEPTNGLDPQGIAEIRQLILKIADQGKTILLASHMLDEVQRICTHVAILKKGRLLDAVKKEDLLKEDPQLEVQSDNLEALTQALKTSPFNLLVSVVGSKAVVDLPQGVTSSDINKYLIEKGVSVTSINTIKKDLESQFLEIIRQND